ncbi:hypothetical protein CR513_06783, partial [Mucuna pruriens]
MQESEASHEEDYAQIEESQEATIARFLYGLNREIQDTVELHHYSTIEDLATNVESQLKRKLAYRKTYRNGSSSWKGKEKEPYMELQTSKLDNLGSPGNRRQRFTTSLLTIQPIPVLTMQVIPHQLKILRQSSTIRPLPTEGLHDHSLEFGRDYARRIRIDGSRHMELASLESASGLDSTLVRNWHSIRMQRRNRPAKSALQELTSDY